MGVSLWQHLVVDSKAMGTCGRAEVVSVEMLMYKCVWCGDVWGMQLYPAHLSDLSIHLPTWPVAIATYSP